MNRNDYVELENLITDDIAMSSKVYRTHSRMIKMSQIFKDSYDTPEFFENNSFGGDRTHKVSEEYRISKTISSIYAGLEELDMVEDYEPFIHDLIKKINNNEIDFKTAKLKLISVGASIGVMTNFYTVFDEYLDHLLEKERNKFKLIKSL